MTAATEYLYHGVRTADAFNSIREIGFRNGFLTENYNLAWKFAVSTYILKFKKESFAEGSLKTTLYDGELQYEYDGQTIKEYEIIHAPNL